MKTNWIMVGIMLALMIIAIFAEVFVLDSLTHKECNMRIVMDADLNTGSEIMQNIHLREINVTAPCGNEGFNIAQTLFEGR